MTRPSPVEDLGVLYEELEALLEAPAGDGAPSRAELEDALTGGYARALALEAERLRLERRIGQAAAGFREGAAPPARELADLAQRLSHADGELDKLRLLLSSLRTRVRDAHH
jgi:hypothetical protein